MLTFNVKSKNKKSLIKFLTFFKLLFKNKNFKIKSKKTKRKTVTLLKSPHVHKKAQEHFQINFYKRKLFTNMLNFRKILLLWKKIFKFSFFDVKLEIILTTKKIKYNKTFLTFNFFYFDCFTKNFLIKKRTQALILLKLLNFKGKAILNVV